MNQQRCGDGRAATFQRRILNWLHRCPTTSIGSNGLDRQRNIVRFDRRRSLRTGVDNQGDDPHRPPDYRPRASRRRTLVDAYPSTKGRGAGRSCSMKRALVHKFHQLSIAAFGELLRDLVRSATQRASHACKWVARTAPQQDREPL